MLELDSCEGYAKKILLFIITLTLTIEAIGALLYFKHLEMILLFIKAIFFSFFHSVSAFCNAGLSPFSGE